MNSLKFARSSRCSEELFIPAFSSRCSPPLYLFLHCHSKPKRISCFRFKHRPRYSSPKPRGDQISSSSCSFGNTCLYSGLPPIAYRGMDQRATMLTNLCNLSDPLRLAVRKIAERYWCQGDQEHFWCQEFRQTALTVENEASID